MRGSAGQLVTALVVVSLLAAGMAAPTVAQSETASSVMHVTLGSGGDAQWTVSLHYSLSDPNDTAAFDRLADEYVTGQTDVLTPDPYRSAAALASDSTGREMAVNNVTRSASRGNDTGELRLSFTWSNFARVEEDGARMVLGDVFTTPESGTWLPGVREDQLLVIEFPPDYSAQTSSHPLDNDSIRVVGPVSFEPGDPSATLERDSGAVDSPGTPNPGWGIGLPAALSGLAVFVILGGLGFLVYRRQELGELVPGTGGTTSPQEEPVDPALLSDEERVLRLLRREGGRMKQVDIVDETDWSNAKVSQLLSSMAESGQVEKLRIGRENLISLPDEDDQ